MWVKKNIIYTTDLIHSNFGSSIVRLYFQKLYHEQACISAIRFNLRLKKYRINAWNISILIKHRSKIDEIFSLLPTQGPAVTLSNYWIRKMKNNKLTDFIFLWFFDLSTFTFTSLSHRKDCIPISSSWIHVTLEIKINQRTTYIRCLFRSNEIF